MSSPQSLITPRNQFPLRLPSRPACNPIQFISDKKKETRTHVENYIVVSFFAVACEKKTDTKLTAEPSPGAGSLPETDFRCKCRAPLLLADAVHYGSKRKKQEHRLRGSYLYFCCDLWHTNRDKTHGGANMGKDRNRNSTEIALPVNMFPVHFGFREKEQR